MSERALRLVGDGDLPVTSGEFEVAIRSQDVAARTQRSISTLIKAPSYVLPQLKAPVGVPNPKTGATGGIKFGSVFWFKPKGEASAEPILVADAAFPEFLRCAIGYSRDNAVGCAATYVRAFEVITHSLAFAQSRRSGVGRINFDASISPELWNPQFARSAERVVYRSAARVALHSFRLPDLDVASIRASEYPPHIASLANPVPGKPTDVYHHGFTDLTTALVSYSKEQVKQNAIG